MDEKKELLEFLKDLRRSQGPWIHRKEIASWSSVAVYFGIILALLKLIPVNCSVLILEIVIVILVCILFLWFIKNQFYSIANASALHHALTYHIFKIINTGQIIQYNYNYICIEQNKIVPCVINNTKKKYEEHFRKLCLIQKICFLFSKQIKIDDKSYSKDKIKLYSTILQLSISSCMVVLITVAFLLYVIIEFFGNSIFLFWFDDIFIFFL